MISKGRNGVCDRRNGAKSFNFCRRIFDHCEGAELAGLNVFHLLCKTGYDIFHFAGKGCGLAWYTPLIVQAVEGDSCSIGENGRFETPHTAAGAGCHIQDPIFASSKKILDSLVRRLLRNAEDCRSVQDRHQIPCGGRLIKHSHCSLAEERLCETEDRCAVVCVVPNRSGCHAARAAGLVYNLDTGSPVITKRLGNRAVCIIGCPAGCGEAIDCYASAGLPTAFRRRTLLALCFRLCLCICICGCGTASGAPATCQQKCTCHYCCQN